jgi:hypothetical protein
MSDDDYPEYSEDAELGDRGRRLVEDIIRDGLRWIFREIPKDDLGIDGYVEVLREDRKSQGRLLAVQIKTGPSYLAEPNDDGFVYRGALKHLNYWTGHTLPVLILLCDPATRTCYWEQVATPNVTRTPKGWKITVPRSKTLGHDQKAEIEKLTEPPQPLDFIPLALYKLLVEKFQYMVMAQDIEVARDFGGFEYLAHLGDDLIVITHIFKPQGATFSTADIDEILRRRDECCRGCGWDTRGPDPRIFLFLVSENVEQLKLSDELKAYISTKPEITYFRLRCSFSFGIYLNELDDNDQFIDMYDRDLPQMRGREKASLPEGESPSASTG